MKSAEEFAKEYYQLPQSGIESVALKSAIRLAEKYHEYAAQQKSEWVPVETDLPKEHRKVLFLTNNVLFPDNSYTGTYVQGKWYVSGNYRPVEAQVTHWMYIPSPPKK